MQHLYLFLLFITLSFSTSICALTKQEEEKVYLRQEIKNHYIIDISERVKLINEKKKDVHIEEISSNNTDIREIRWKKSVIEKKCRKNILYGGFFGMMTMTASAVLFWIMNGSGKRAGPIKGLEKWEVVILMQLAILSFGGFYNATRSFFRASSLYKSAHLLGRIENQIKKVTLPPQKKEDVKSMKKLSK